MVSLSWRMRLRMERMLDKDLGLDLGLGLGAGRCGILSYYCVCLL